jgi:adenylate kinase
MKIGAAIFLGPPGAGKGTQARGIGLRLGVPAISTGDMMRALAAAGNPEGDRARTIMGKGDLIPDEWMNALVQERLKQPDCGDGFVLDGYPRTRGQAEALDAMLAGSSAGIKVFDFRIQCEDVIRRMTGRRVCSSCGAIYNIYGKPPRQAGHCDRDGAPLATRDDDRAEVIRERLASYERLTRPVIDWFRQTGREIYVVDASRSMEEIAEQVCRILSAP